jgi:hypothetical protein
LAWLITLNEKMHYVNMENDIQNGGEAIDGFPGDYTG